MPTQSEEPSHYGRISVVSVVEGNLGAGVCEALKECGKCLWHRDDWWPSQPSSVLNSWNYPHLPCESPQKQWVKTLGLCDGLSQNTTQALSTATLNYLLFCHTLAHFHSPNLVVKCKVCTATPFDQTCNKGNSLETRERQENEMLISPNFFVCKMAAQALADVTSPVACVQVVHCKHVLTAMQWRCPDAILHTLMKILVKI